MDLAYIERILGDRPKAYWPLMETQGLTAFDWVRNYHGTIKGGVTLGQPSAPGLPGTAMAFDGSTGYIPVPAAALNSASAFSIEAWANPSSLQEGGIFAAQQGSLTSSGGYFGPLLGMEGQGYVVASPTWTAQGAYIGSPHPLTAGEWAHIVATETSSGVFTLYINGLPVQEGSLALALPSSMEMQFGAMIGTDWDFSAAGGVYYFPGSLANVAIYDYALTPNQVQAHYFGRPRDLIN